MWRLASVPSWTRPAHDSPSGRFVRFRRCLWVPVDTKSSNLPNSQWIFLFVPSSGSSFGPIGVHHLNHLRLYVDVFGRSRLLSSNRSEEISSEDLFVFLHLVCPHTTVSGSTLVRGRVLQQIFCSEDFHQELLLSGRSATSSGETARDQLPVERSRRSRWGPRRLIHKAAWSASWCPDRSSGRPSGHAEQAIWRLEVDRCFMRTVVQCWTPLKLLVRCFWTQFRLCREGHNIHLVAGLYRDESAWFAIFSSLN